MKFWAPAAAISAFGLALCAQNPPKPVPPPQADEPTRIQVDVTRVPMLFTVTDKKGRFITDLVKEDFEVLENKKRQEIAEFNAESDLPLRIAVLIDTSNSIRERFRFEQEAASEFVKSVIKSKLDKGMVVSFDTQPELAADLVEDTNVLEKAIRGLRPGGGTALYDAIYFACKDKLQRDQPSTKYRRAMVLLSDGDDNNSRYTRDQALEMAQKADAVMYAISTNLSKIESDGDKVLKYMTAETGGRAFFPFKVEDLEVSFENLASELRHQYNLSYRPEPLVADGLFHPIDLRVKGRKDLVVHARRGYYAPRK
jgi:Ca-activated chloride channel family protein